MTTRATSSGWICSAARPPSMCWRSIAPRWASTACPRKCSPTTGGSTPPGAARPGSSRSCKRTASTTSAASPHHPMTLGKIERFWKTIWEDFLVRAQFDSFEQARERVRLWVKYYNHKRPHQGLEGMCPADRFFAIAQGAARSDRAGHRGQHPGVGVARATQEPVLHGRTAGRAIGGDADGTRAVQSGAGW